MNIGEELKKTVGTTIKMKGKNNDYSRCLWDFEHPKQATYFFGPEDGSLPEEVLKKCQYKVSILTNICLNLAVAFGIVMNDRSMKNERAGNKDLLKKTIKV